MTPGCLKGSMFRDHGAGYFVRKCPMLPPWRHSLRRLTPIFTQLKDLTIKRLI
jgi:hypothetical protein